MSGFSRLKDLLHAALVPRVEMSNVEEVQQHLRHIFILVDDILEKKEEEKKKKKKSMFSLTVFRGKTSTRKEKKNPPLFRQ